MERSILVCHGVGYLKQYPVNQTWPHTDTGAAAPTWGFPQRPEPPWVKEEECTRINQLPLIFSGSRQQPTLLISHRASSIIDPELHLSK